VAVMALERVPAESGGGRRRAYGRPQVITRIMDTVSIPVMAKCRIGHFAEARVLEAARVDFIAESEVLTPADEAPPVDKLAFKDPVRVRLPRPRRGPPPDRRGGGARATKGEAGTGNIVEAVRHMRAVTSRHPTPDRAPPEERMAEAKALGAPYEL